MIDWGRLFRRAEPEPSDEAKQAEQHARRQRAEARASARKWAQLDRTNGYGELVEGLFKK